MTLLPARLSLSASEDVEETVEVCRREGLGIEIGFAYPAELDTPDLGDDIVRLREVVEGIEPVSSHGPFIDLYAASRDPAIVEVCRDRHERALEASLAVGASVYVAHLNSIPLIRSASYRDTFVERTADFWRPFAEVTGRDGATIVLENMWEPGPELLCRVVDEVDHPALGACFDNGHALVFSDRAASDWVRALGDRLVHVHLHDNDGDYDDHHPVGEGCEDWPALLSALAAEAPEALVVLETDRLEPNLRSLKHVRALADAHAERP